MSTPQVKTIQKTLIHKKVEFTNIEEPSTFTLQSLITEALKTTPRALERSQTINEDSPFKRVIGSYKTDRSILIGQVLLYEDGTDITFLVENPITSELEIDTAPVSEDPKGRKKEVLQGALYFSIYGNDIAVAQSQSVNFKAFENHINWLLKDRSVLLPSECAVMLINQPTEAVEQAVQSGDFKSFGIGSPIAGATNTTIEDTESISTKVGGSIDKLRGIIRELWTDELNLEEDLDTANLELFVQLRYKRSTNEQGQDFLDKLARATRHFDPEDTIIKTKEGKTIHGDELRLSVKRSVQSYNGVLDRDDVYGKLIDWIEELNRQGYLG